MKHLAELIAVVYGAPAALMLLVIVGAAIIFGIRKAYEWLKR